MTVSPCNIRLSVFERTTNSFWTENKTKNERKQKHIDPILLELYTESVFSGRYWSVFLGIYHIDTERNLGRYISVWFFLAGNPISLKKGAMAPFFRKKGAPAPFLIQPAPLLQKKGVPAKLVIPTGNTDRQINLICTGKIPIPKKLLVTPWYL